MDKSPKIKISVITVVYNGEKSLEQAILSVVDQTYTNIEYIIIDGGSTDNTVNIIKKFSEKIHFWSSEPDEGIYDAMNKGLKVATGDWVYFLGDDDILSGNTIIEQVTEKFDNKTAIYYGDVFWKESKLLYKFKLTKWAICMRNISHQSIFYPKNIYKTHPYDLRYRLFADHIYNMDLYASKKNIFIYVPLLIAVYNDAGTSKFPNDKNYYSDLPEIVYKKLGAGYALYVWLRYQLFFKKEKVKAFFKK